MLISKSKMPILINALDLLLAQDEDRPEGEEELVKQIRDRCSLCLHGDAPFLKVEVAHITNKELYERTRKEIRNIINGHKIRDRSEA